MNLFKKNYITYIKLYLTIKRCLTLFFMVYVYYMTQEVCHKQLKQTAVWLKRPIINIKRRLLCLYALQWNTHVSGAVE